MANGYFVTATGTDVGKTFVTAINFSNEKVALPKDFTDKKIILDSESNFDKNFLKPLEARIFKF